MESPFTLLLNALHEKSVIPLVYLVIQLVVSYYVFKYLQKIFSREYSDIPPFKVEVPKKKGGTFTPEMAKTNKDVIVCYNPANMELLGTAPVMTPTQVEDAVKKARAAQVEWAKTSFAERRRVLRTFINFFVENQQDVCQVSRDETGKTIFEGVAGEVMTTCGKMEWLVDNGEEVLKPEVRPSGSLMAHKKGTLYYVPYGVIGIIIPWNFPIHNVFSHISNALFAGNACVVKVSEWASWSKEYIENIVKTGLKATGHNPDLVQFVTGFGETGSAVVSMTDKILFIGSPEVGKRVMETASKTLTPVILELGGKDPYIVCDDAPLNHATNMAVRGSFFNCGQNCISAERFLVYEKVYDKFVEEVVSKVQKVRQGFDNDSSRCDIGSINLPTQINRYEALISDALEKGAKLVAGGKVRQGVNGHFFEPTILIDINPTMRIMHEEIFGPIMAIVKVKSDEEVIKIANNCNFALGCSIFTHNAKRARKLGLSISSGMTVVNDWGLFFTIIALPFGGVKHSGFGRFNGPEGLREFTYHKTFVEDRFPIVVEPPPFMNYPTTPKAHLLFEDAVKILYQRGISNKVFATIRLLKRVVTRDM